MTPSLGFATAIARCFQCTVVPGPCFVFAFNNQVCTGPGFVNVSLVYEKLLEDIVVAPDDLFLAERFVQRKNCWKLLDLDPHTAPCFFQQVLVFVREKENRFFRMVDDSVSKVGLIVENQGDVIRAGNVLAVTTTNSSQGMLESNEMFVMFPRATGLRTVTP